MTARDYLIQQLSDPEPNYSDHKTKMALAAYAKCFQKGKQLYNMNDAKRLIYSLVKDEEFTDKCLTYISNISEYEGFVFPSFIEDI